MPIFDNVAKVIAVPGDPGGGGCATIVGGVTLVLIFGAVMVVVRACVGDNTAVKVQNQPVKVTVPQQQPPIQRPIVQPNLPPAPPAAPQPRTIFVPLGPHQYPTPDPMPTFLGGEANSGEMMFAWGSRRWFLSPEPNKPYHYLCVVNGNLNWCWPDPPNDLAHECSRSSDGEKGWCWER
jgi:hypothetical protein